MTVSMIPMFVLWWNVEGILLKLGQGEFIIRYECEQGLMSRIRCRPPCRQLLEVAIDRYSRIRRNSLDQEVSFTF
jgi:hypothetical protein